MRLTEAHQHAAAFREMCAADILDKQWESGTPPRWFKKAAAKKSELAAAASSSEPPSSSNSGGDGAWELWMSAADVAVDADADADDADETVAGEALDLLTAARVCQAAAEGALVGAPTASHSRAILRAVAPRHRQPHQHQQHPTGQPPSSASHVAAAATAAAAAAAAAGGEHSSQPPSSSPDPWQPRSRLALFALAAEMIGTVPSQCLVIPSAAAAAAAAAAAPAPIGATVQGILSAARRWNEARRWARAAGSLVNNNSLGFSEVQEDEQGQNVCDVHAVTEAQAAALLVGGVGGVDSREQQISPPTSPRPAAAPPPLVLMPLVYVYLPSLPPSPPHFVKPVNGDAMRLVSHVFFFSN